MLTTVIISSFGLFTILSLYLLLFSSYRIRNLHGFLLLLSTFTIHSIFICIFPLTQFYLIYFLLFIDLNSFHCFYHSILIFYCLCESFFYFFTIEETRLLNNRPLPLRPRLPKNYDEQLIDRVLNVYEKSKEDFRVCFAGFFDRLEQNSYDSIYKDNILQFIAMTTYGVRYWDEMNKKQQRRIERLYTRYLTKYPQKRLKIKPGYNNQIQLRHPYKDNLRYTYYPMIKYIFFASIRSLSTMLLTLNGYEYQVIDNVPFYIRKSSKQTNLPPILFLHGLSLGPTSYILFIRRLSLLNRTIILLDIPHASMRLHTEILPLSNILSSIEELLNSINIKKIITISHSYGTIVHSCLIKQLTHFVQNQPSIFIDPVCFLLFDAHYLENFIYRQPRTPNQLLLFTSCTDLYSIYPIERHLCWYECVLWAEDVQQSQIRIHVFLSENDDLVPVAIVNEYLMKSHIDTTVFRQFKHSQFLISEQFQLEVLKTLERLET
ncbi:hypothetical protein I4U23_010385 [Adineta vaga]|nr:hypothetical protein I4U23_010385 [Adineta vaga]